MDDGVTQEFEALRRQRFEVLVLGGISLLVGYLAAYIKLQGISLRTGHIGRMSDLAEEWMKKLDSYNHSYIKD